MSEGDQVEHDRRWWMFPVYVLWSIGGCALSSLVMLLGLALAGVALTYVVEWL